MASPPPPPPMDAGGESSDGADSAATAPIDTLFLQNLMNRVQLRPPFLDTNSYLTESIDDLFLRDLAALSAAVDLSDADSDREDLDADDGANLSSSKDGRRSRLIAREEARLEREIVRIVQSGDFEAALRPNSGQSVPVGDHHVCVGFHEDARGEYRVWEWHGHVMLFDDEDGYSAEYIYGNHFERLTRSNSGGNDSRRKEPAPKKEESDASSGLRDLIGGGNNANGGKGLAGGSGKHVVHRNSISNGSSAAVQAASLASEESNT